MSLTRDTLVGLAHMAEERATAITLRSEHGPRHWRDVARIGLEVAQPETNLDAVFLFAAFHDSQRWGLFEDPEHGRRACGVLFFCIHELKTTVPDWFTDLAKALVQHDTGRVSSDSTIGACWDADRLTLGRVGISPDPRFLTPATAKRLPDLLGRVVPHIVEGDSMTWREIAFQYERAANEPHEHPPG